MAEQGYLHGERFVAEELEAMRAMGVPVGARTARVIAATSRPEPDTSLYRFAYDGEVTPGLADEIPAVPLDLLQPQCVEALAAFVQHALAFAAQPEGEHPPGSPLGPPTAYRPSLYLAPPSGLGAWLDATLTPTAFARALDELRVAAPALPWTVHASAGFYGASLASLDSLGAALELARGIVRHGEAYSWYPTYAAASPHDSGEFEEHYYGRFISAEQFVMERGSENGWLTALREFSERHDLVGLVTLDVEGVLRTYFDSYRFGFWLHIAGEEGEYVFGPSRRGT